MNRRPLVPALLAGMLALVLACAGTAPANATETVKVRISSNDATQENGVATFRFEYRCEPGATAVATAVLWQGGTAASPGTIFTTDAAPPADRPDLVCDGLLHEDGITVILVGWTDDLGPTIYPYLCDTQYCELKATATVTITSSTGGSDVDDRRLKVRSR